MSSIPIPPIVYNIPNIITIPVVSYPGMVIQTQTVTVAASTETTCEAIAEEKKFGFSCKRCEEFNEFAEANQPDKTFVCYKCRHGL